MARVDNFKWFERHREEIIKGHEGQSVIIQNCSVAGYYDSDDEALAVIHGQDIDTFVIQKCLPAELTDMYYHTGEVIF